MVRHEDAITDCRGIDDGSDLDDLRGELMPDDEGRLRLAVPLHDVRATNPARLHADEDFSGSDPGLRQLDNPDTVVRVVHRAAHAALLLRLRALPELERLPRRRALVDDRP